MIKCREATRLASEALDRQLSPGERLSLALHRLICPPCRRFAEQLQWMRQMARTFVAPTEPFEAE